MVKIFFIYIFFWLIATDNRCLHIEEKVCESIKLLLPYNFFYHHSFFCTNFYKIETVVEIGNIDYGDGKKRSEAIINHQLQISL